MDILSDPPAPTADRRERPAPDVDLGPRGHRRRLLRRSTWLQLSVVAFVALVAVGLLVLPAPFLLHHPGVVIDATANLEGPAVADATFGDGGRFLLTTQRTTPLTWGGYLWFSARLPAGSRIVPLPAATRRSDYVSLAAMDQSKDIAAAVAACVVDRCTPEPVGVRVVRVTSGSPADRGGLRTADVIVAATRLPSERAYPGDTTAPVHTSLAAILRFLQLVETTASQTSDSTVRLQVLREGTLTTLSIRPDGGPLGADVVTAWVAQRSMEVDTGSVGGPSTGLMLTLTLIDALTEGDLAGGRRIAGTGTIAADGTIGPIGGVEAKVAGAARAQAEVFLVPPVNAAEARRAAPSAMQVVETSTLDDALRWLCGVAEAPRSRSSEALILRPSPAHAAGRCAASAPHRDTIASR